ncbi:MAG: AAA family ATPase [Candidatus Hodarchaeales archaeon]|jgi:Cdc6-like AAA superfamily ATPase
MIIKDRKWLDEDFIPSKLLFRDSQVKDLEYTRAIVIDHQASGSYHPSASDVLLLGGPGTGKTALLRDMLAKARNFLARSPNTKGKVAYIDCSKFSNERSFWVNLSSEIGVYYTSTTSLDQIKTDALNEIKENMALLLLLDEVDVLIIENPEAFDTITNLMSRELGVTLCAAANRKDWRKSLGEKNTFNPRIINCPEYNSYQLHELATDRLFYALNVDYGDLDGLHDLIQNEAISIISNRAYRIGGDARKLIKMLRLAVEEAEMNENPSITVKEAHYSTQMIDDDAQQLHDSLMQKSHDVHTVLLAIKWLNDYDNRIDEDEGVRSLEVVNKYQELIEKSDPNEEPLKYRSIMDLLQKLLTEGLINRQRAKTRGNVWYYEINEDYFSGEDIVKQLDKLCPKCQLLVGDKTITV